MARAVAQKEDRQWSNPTSKSQPHSAGKDLIAGMHDFKIHGPWNFACVFFHFLPFSPYWGLWNLNDTNSSSLFLAQVQVWRTVSPETAWPALGVHHCHPCPAKSSIRRCKIWAISMETPSTLNSMFKWKSMTQRNQQLERALVSAHLESTLNEWGMGRLILWFLGCETWFLDLHSICFTRLQDLALQRLTSIGFTKVHLGQERLREKTLRSFTASLECFHFWHVPSWFWRRRGCSSCKRRWKSLKPGRRWPLQVASAKAAPRGQASVTAFFVKNWGENIRIKKKAL